MKVNNINNNINLAEMIIKRNLKRPGNPCVLHGDKCYTYRDLFCRIASLKKFLLEHARKGERVGLFSENGIHFMSAYLACLDSGLVVVPVNTGFSKEETDYAVANCGIKFFLSSEKMKKRLDVPVPVFLIGDVPAEKSFDLNEHAGPAVKENGLAALMHTSGSTGKPNSVMITHGNLLANTRSIMQYLRPNEKDRVMVVLPFYYCYGASLMHMTLATGGQLVINNKFMFPQKVVDEIRDRKCTIFAGVPSTYQIMMKYTRMGELDLSCLRYALQAGGKLPNDDLKRLKEMLPKTDVIVMYGQTEATARLSYLPKRFFHSKFGSIGKGIPGVELQVVDRSGNRVKPGESGEIRARGKNISPGYLNNELETKTTFRDGWLYTGDLATVDDDGFVYVVGRKKNFVKVGGNRFSLTEVEGAVMKMDGVREAVALAVPDELLGERVELFVALEKPNTTAGQVLDFCKKKLPRYKLPKMIRIIDEIPRNAYGKMQKHKLLEP